MKRHKLTRSEKRSKGGPGKGNSFYRRKREYLLKVKMWGFEFPIGKKPWK